MFIRSTVFNSLKFISLVIILSIAGCRFGSESTKSSKIATTRGTVVEEFPIQRIDSVIKSLQKAKKAYLEGKYLRYHAAMHKTKTNFNKKKKTKYLKAGIKIGHDGECFFGRYSSVISLALRYQALNSVDRIFLDMKSDGNENRGKTVQKLFAKVKKESVDQSLEFPRCAAHVVRNPQNHNFPGAIKCNGGWIWNLWGDERIRECNPENICFAGSQSDISSYLDEEFSFDSSDEFWYEYVSVPDADTIIFDAVDGPNEEAYRNLKLKRCATVPNNPEVYYGPITTASPLIKNQLRTYIRSQQMEEAGRPLEWYFDDDLILVRPVKFRGIEGSYTYIKGYMGDTEVGGVFKTGTTEIVGDNGDGDFTVNGRWASEN